MAVLRTVTGAMPRASAISASAQPLQGVLDQVFGAVTVTCQQVGEP